jgi:hypothetical protein
MLIPAVSWSHVADPTGIPRLGPTRDSKSDADVQRAHSSFHHRRSFFGSINQMTYIMRKSSLNVSRPIDSIKQSSPHRCHLLPTSTATTTMILGLGMLLLLLLQHHHGTDAMMMSMNTNNKNTYNTIVRNQKVPGLKHGMDYIQLGDSDLIVSKICCKCG